MIRIYSHPGAKRDAEEIFDYLSDVSSAAATKFTEEFESAVYKVAHHPGVGHPCGRFRRRNIRRLSYHILYLQRGNEIWIMVVRHDARHPSYGMRRRIPENS